MNQEQQRAHVSSRMSTFNVADNHSHSRARLDKGNAYETRHVNPCKST